MRRAILSQKPLEEITSLLDCGAPIVSPQGTESALNIAADNMMKDLVSLLLDRGADVNMVGSEYGTALAEAALAGNTDTVLLLLDGGADVNVVGGNLGTALAAAALEKNTDTVSLLLDRGADVNMVGGEYGTALAAASFEENTDTVLLLLDRGADVNMVGGKYGTALAAAAYQGNTHFVSLLLDRGANVNMVGGEFGTALVAAAYKGNTDTVLLLLGGGADVNKVVDGKYGTALSTAVFMEEAEVVSLLLDRGADANIVGGEYGTPLATAAFIGRKSTVSLLLDQGADVNMVVDGEFGTALAAAALEKNTDTVSLLLDRGADVNMVGGEYGTALAAASFEENTDTVRLLLDRGADVNMVGGEFGTALAVAAYKGNTDTVSLLLDGGADVNMVVDGKYGTALGVAAFMEMSTTVSLLLDRGADVNMVGGEYGTALAAAAYKGKTHTLSLLLDGGADVNMVVDGKYGTALGAAAFMEMSTTVSLLLDRGAYVNMVGGEYGTALAAAAFMGTTTVSLLLDRGADVNMVGGEYGTALAAAAYKGKTHTVSLLLDRGANVNMVVDGKYGTALGAAVFRQETDTVSLLIDRGADINLVTGSRGTLLGRAIYDGILNIKSLLELGADVTLVGGSYPTSSGVYPSAWDVAHSEGSSVDPTSLILLIGKQNVRTAGANLANNPTSRPPFPMPYTRPYPAFCATHPNGTLPSANVQCQVGGVIWCSLAALINIVIGICGTLLGRAIYDWILNTESLLELGADVMRIGGSHPTSSGVYPSTLDVAHSEGSSVDPLPSGKMSEFCASGNITPEQANVSCQGQVGDVVWRSLAALVGLHEDTIQAKQEWIQNDVRYFVACNYDFGLAYAAARVAWAHLNKPSVDCNVISIRRARWHKHAQMLDEARSKVIKIDSEAGQELIVSPYSVMPRRIWDLKSNRVVDFRMLHAAQPTSTNMPPTTPPTFWAVTHGWTNDMSPVWTAINQYQWPVPLPKDISLEFLRSELLTLGAEYVWVDVLCLRQKSEDDHLEKLRVEEWKLDVPTIGNVYRAASNIVRYFNGLGVRFCTQNWDGPRHWLQRAWTLQEIADEKTTINGGISQNQGQVFLNSSSKVSGKVIKLRSALRPVLQLAAQLDCSYGCELYELVREMSRRYATQPLDKLAGLFYLLRTTKLPCYDAKKTSEDVWKQCFHLLPLQQKAQVLFDFPYRASEEQWFPTWAQALEWPVRDPEYDHVRSLISPDSIKTFPGKVPLFIKNTLTISNATLIETNNPSEYQVKINNSLFGFYQPYLLQKPIDIEEPVFTLAAIDFGHAHNWLVCRATEKYEWVGGNVDLGVAEFKILKKVGVLRTDTSSELSVVRGLVQRNVDCLFV